MEKRRLMAGILAVGTVLLFLAPAALAVIKALTPLRTFLRDGQYILVARVDKIHPQKPGVLLKVSEEFKGKAPFRMLPVNLKGDSGAQKGKDTERLLKRLAPELPLVLFVNHRGKRFTAFAYTNGTWFQVIGQESPTGTAWSLTHLEPYLRRTFKGSTTELVQIVQDSLAGKMKPPEPNAKEQPGIGPEVKKKETTNDCPLSVVRGPWSNIKSQKSKVDGTKILDMRRLPFDIGPWTFDMGLLTTDNGQRTPLFAVIPTLGLGGPLAILALLFPSLFGGVLILFRRWLAFFSVISGISLLYLLRWGWGEQLRQTGLGTANGWWFALLLITFLGAFWAWRRHWILLGTGQETGVPGRSEAIILWTISLTCLVAVLYYLLSVPPGTMEWHLFLSFAGGIWTATVYKLLRSVRRSNQTPTELASVVPCLRATAPAMPTEGLMLGTTLFLLAGCAVLRSGPGETAGQGQTAQGARAKLVGKSWDYQVKDSGCIVSSPCVGMGRVYFASAHPTFKGGTLFCLNRATGDELWQFLDDGAMKPVYSSPCLAGNRLFIGEGFHDDPNCKLYCLDARNGKKIWDFQTTSQVESSPCVVEERVFFGAGNDGLYCLEAATGKKIWQFAGKSATGRLLRVGGSPLVDKGKLFAGSGVDRNLMEDQGETAVFCLDSRSGKLLWKKETPLPSWGKPVLAGNQVFFGLGNGDVFSDAPEPAGLLLCLAAETGQLIWQVDVPNGILGAPAVDEEHVYFGCRDGHCYCVGRGNGREIWKTPLGSPVIASPVLAPSLKTGDTASVFAVGSGGKVRCLDPATGKIDWTFTLEEYRPFLSATPQVVVTHTLEGERRHIYIAATLDDPANGRPVLYRLNDFLPDGSEGDGED